jgi:hypothetical protein
MKAPLLSLRRVVIAGFCIAATVGLGCSGGGSNGSLGAGFTASTTTSAPNLVKLVKKSTSGTLLVVDVVIYGATTSQDLYSFAFDIGIGDPTVVKFVPASAVAGNALQAGTGQTIQAVADLGTLGGGGVDNSRVVVGVTKLGGGSGSGNGVATSAVVVTLSFQVLKAGSTTLTLTGNPTPKALDSDGAAIGSITFDAASASVTGVSTGGGGY